MSAARETKGVHVPVAKKRHGPVKATEEGKENHGPYGRSSAKRPKLASKVRPDVSFTF